MSKEKKYTRTNAEKYEITPPSDSNEAQQSIEPNSDSRLLQNVGYTATGLVMGATVAWAARKWMNTNRTRHVVDGEKCVMEFNDASKILGTAEPGQLLEFDRSEGYAHFALYLGNGMVMNIENNLLQGILQGKAKIREVSLTEVCEGNKVRIRNHDDLAFEKYKVGPNSRAEILEFAYLMKDQTVHYNVLETNCEYYSTLWRYGVGFSAQVNYFPPK